MVDFSRQIFLLFIYLLLLIGFVPSLGLYSFSGAVIIFFVWLLLFLFFLKPLKLPCIDRDAFLFLLKIFLVISLTLSCLYYGLLYPDFPFFSILGKWLMAGCFLSSIFLFVKSKKVFKNVFIFLFISAFIIKIFVLFSSPSPIIDVFEILKKGSLALVNGENPYSITYKQFYQNVTPDFFSYLPGILLLTTPVVMVFGDPRFVFIFSDIASSFLLLSILKKEKQIARLLILIYLFMPRSFFMLEQSWIEPAILMCFLLFFKLVRKHKNLAALIMGLILATKQIFMVLPLFLYRFFSFKKENIFKAILAALLIILPFFLWGPKDFVGDTFFYHLDPQRSSAPFKVALTFGIFIINNFGIRIPMGISLILSLTALFLPFFLFNKEKANFFAVIAFAYLGFFYFSFQAYFNYYFLIAGLLLFSVAADCAQD